MKRSLRLLLVTAATSVATAFLAVHPAAAIDLTAGPLVQVSGTSPFAACTADDVPGQSGEVFLNSEVEPWIDVNPTDPDNIVGMWQQDRWSNGGSRGHVAGVSVDGGSSWTQVVVPSVTVCSGGTAANGGNYQRTTDPWLSFGPDGTLHQISLSFNDIAPPFGPRTSNQEETSTTPCSRAGRPTVASPGPTPRSSSATSTPTSSTTSRRSPRTRRTPTTCTRSGIASYSRTARPLASGRAS